MGAQIRTAAAGGGCASGCSSSRESAIVLPELFPSITSQRALGYSPIQQSGGSQTPDGWTEPPRVWAVHRGE